MKILTIKTDKAVPAQTQLDIHYTFRMEHHTDYVMKDRDGKEYSATISMEDTSRVIEVIIEKSAEFPEYSFIIDDLDMEAQKITRLHISRGKTDSRKEGALSWNE